MLKQNSSADEIKSMQHQINPLKEVLKLKQNFQKIK